MLFHRIGTSGWNYAHWKEIFYPSDLGRPNWLTYYAHAFDTVEVNATFYRLPNTSTFVQWYQKTPPHFQWAVKASKFITHTRRLEDVGEPLERFYSAVQGLKEKLGPLLFQLPPSLRFHKESFIRFCKNLQQPYRHVLEIRHPSWIDPAAFELMGEFHIAFCIADTAGRYPYHEEITTDFLYIRLHGSKKLYASDYTEEELRTWAGKIRKWKRDAYVYFDNDFHGYAVKNAKRLKGLLT